MYYVLCINLGKVNIFVEKINYDKNKNVRLLDV